MTSIQLPPSAQLLWRCQGEWWGGPAGQLPLGVALGTALQLLVRLCTCSQQHAPAAACAICAPPTTCGSYKGSCPNPPVNGTRNFTCTGGRPGPSVAYSNLTGPYRGGQARKGKICLL